MSRVAVVTGGASGIGLGCARRLLRDGHKVAVVDVRGDAVADAATTLRAAGVAIGVTADVADRSQMDDAIARVRAELGPIGIVVTSAGISSAAFFADMTLDQWNRMIAVNLTGTFNCIQAAIPDMVAARWGRIVTIASTAAQSGARDRAHYAAAKAGVVGLTKSLSAEFAPLGITSNTIPPSMIDTPMVNDPANHGAGIDMDALAAMAPVRRIGTPDDIAAACSYLCSEEAGFVTGQQINVNGGVYV